MPVVNLKFISISDVLTYCIISKYDWMNTSVVIYVNMRPDSTATELTVNINCDAIV